MYTQSRRQGRADRPGAEHTNGCTTWKDAGSQVMFLGDAIGGIAARVEGTHRGRGGTNTWEEAGPRIPGQSCGARIQNCDHEHEVKDSFERE